MDWLSLLKLLLLLLIKSLLVSTDTVSVHGNPASGNHNLQCMTDYLFTINCSLKIPPTANTSGSNCSYWLMAVKGQRLRRKTFVCTLIQNAEDYFCSIQMPKIDYGDDYNSNAFIEQDSFKFSLCHKPNDGPEKCDPLMDSFKPHRNIKPNSPCCLNVSHQFGQHRFTWESTYEKYIEATPLPEYLMYELHYYKRGEKIISHTINTAKMNYSVDDHEFLPDTEYSARVRSSPNQDHYKGQWSGWSSEINWRTKPSVNDLISNTLRSRLAEKVFIPLCVMVLLVLLLCYAPIKKWRQKAFIPTPAPYFHTLYHDCQGDFKSWVVTQENTADMLKTEETLQIDTLTKCADVQVEEEEEEEEGQPQCQHQFMEGSTYSNIADPRLDISLLGVPYAVSTMSPLSDPGSLLESLTFSSPPGSPAEGDSGCWLSSHTSLEKDPPWYCNEYCTLSAFQQISPGPAMKLCTDKEEQSGCHF